MNEDLRIRLLIVDDEPNVRLMLSTAVGASKPITSRILRLTTVSTCRRRSRSAGPAP